MRFAALSICSQDNQCIHLCQISRHHPSTSLYTYEHYIRKSSRQYVKSRIFHKLWSNNYLYNTYKYLHNWTQISHWIERATSELICRWEKKQVRKAVAKNLLAKHPYYHPLQTTTHSPNINHSPGNQNCIELRVYKQFTQPSRHSLIKHSPSPFLQFGYSSA